MPHLDMEPAASQHRGGQLGGDDRHEIRDERQPSLSKSRVRPRRALHEGGAGERRGERRQPFCDPAKIRDGYEGADVVYANSWGALPYYGDPEREWNLSRAYVRFIVDEGKMAMTNKAIFGHCLPVRRNVDRRPMRSWTLRVAWRSTRRRTGYT